MNEAFLDFESWPVEIEMFQDVFITLSNTLQRVAYENWTNTFYTIAKNGNTRWLT